jgi:peptide/nickel transport system substrate-binding protein
MSRRTKVLGSLLLVLALLMGACGSDDDSGDGGSDDTAAAEEVVSGGSATVVQPVDAATLDPTTPTNSPLVGSTVPSAVFDTLYLIDDDGGIIPRIATDFSSDDGITWTMTLRDGVTFSDGTPFDAEAVRAQWERIKENIRGTTYAYMQRIASMTAVDPTTFEVVLTSENRQFYRTTLITSLQWIPSPTAYAEKGENFANDPVGAGPFVVTSRTQGSETVLEKNPTYWQDGLPKLDTLVVRTINDPQQAGDTVFTGGAQAAVGQTDQIAQQAEDDGLTAMGVNMIGGGNWLYTDKRPPFDDIRARQAVYYALDMEALNETITGGAAETPKTLFPEASPFYNPDIEFPQPDPEEAQRLFDELASEGKPVSFVILTPQGDNDTRARAMQTQLASFENVEVQIDAVDGSTYGTRLYTGDFDLALYGLAGPDPEPQVAVFTTGWANPIAIMNDPDIDAAVRAGETATSVEDRKAAYDDLNVALNDLFRITWMTRTKAWAIEAQDVGGLELYGMGTPLFENFGRVG